jgi:hypothetical protein
MLINKGCFFSITMSETGNATDESVQVVIEELSQIKDPEFYKALMEQLDRLSLHKRSFAHEDLNKLFKLAFTYANSSLKKELREEQGTVSVPDRS